MLMERLSQRGLEDWGADTLLGLSAAAWRTRFLNQPINSWLSTVPVHQTAFILRLRALVLDLADRPVPAAALRQAYDDLIVTHRCSVIFADILLARNPNSKNSR